MLKYSISFFPLKNIIGSFLLSGTQAYLVDTIFLKVFNAVFNVAGEMALTVYSSRPETEVLCSVPFCHLRVWDNAGIVN